VGRERGYPLGSPVRRATPTMRMAPSRSNFPYPAPTAASKREEKAVTSGRLTAHPAIGRGRSVYGRHVGPSNCRPVRACAVKPCAFGAPL
jgi:hypothetical protein